jgi:hypothetical protein
MAEPVTQPRHQHAGSLSIGSSTAAAFSAGMAASVIAPGGTVPGAIASGAMNQGGGMAAGAPSPGLSSSASQHPGASPRGGRAQPSTLFASEQPMATVSHSPSHATGAEQHRSQSLFGRVTGRLGFRQAAEPAAPPRAASPDLARPRRRGANVATATVRESGMASCGQSLCCDARIVVISKGCEEILRNNH